MSIYYEPGTEGLVEPNHHLNAALEAVAEVARKLKQERDEARELNAKLIALAERAIDDLGWFYESHADGISSELEKLKEAAK